MPVESSPAQVDIQPLVRMVIAQMAGMEANVAVPALHAALCELTRVQFNGDSTSSALTIIENTLVYYRTHQRPLAGLTLRDEANPKDVQ